MIIVFSQDTLEMCARETEFKSILFALCYFHAVVCERRKFGAQGWNRVYPYNTGDLRISVMVLYNYLEANAKVPWEDLRYLFGEIMYGGHITDDWDRKLCKTYLEVYLHPDMVCISYLPPDSHFLHATTFTYLLHRCVLFCSWMASFTWPLASLCHQTQTTRDTTTTLMNAYPQRVLTCTAFIQMLKLNS